MAVDYKANPAGIRAMLGSQFMVAEMRRRMDLGRIYAEKIAPVDTGAYAFDTPNRRGNHNGGFKVTAGVRQGIAFGRLSNSVRSKPSRKWPHGYPYAIALEFGNSRTRRQRPLGRAIDAIAGKN